MVAELDSPFQAALRQREQGTLQMVRSALQRGDAKLAFQPIVCSDGRGIAFYEGLIRVLDESGRIIPARDFMGAVEETDLGRQIDCIALKLGLEMLQSNPWLRLSINMSARSIGYPRWMSVLNSFLSDQPQVAERLILEITETSVMQVPELVSVFMADLHEKGITFALDDFGAGYTAFRHLKTFVFDILKIDGQFSRNIALDPDNQVLTEALLSLGRHFDMLVVAEAVETEAEANWLTHCGVDCLQGYYYGAPLMRLLDVETAPLAQSI